jgi:hypothetical protein
MLRLYSSLHVPLLTLVLCGGLSLMATACEPIVDFSSTATQTTDSGGGDGILRPTQAVVRPKATVDVPADPLIQIRLLTNDSSKGWQLKKRQRKGIDAMQPCNQDDGLVLYESKRIDFEIGPIRCGLEDVKQTGFWQLTDRPSLLVSSGGENPYEVQLLELSTNRLVIAYTDEENEPVLESYETPVAQEPVESGPIVLTPTPTPTPRAQISPSSTTNSAESEPPGAEVSPSPAAPGSGAFKTGL